LEKRAGENDPMSHDTVAARALLAHFNSQLADRLVRRVLKVHDKEAGQRLADAILDQIPIVAGQKVYHNVLNFVTEATPRYLESRAFQEKSKARLEPNIDQWMRDESERKIRDLASQHASTVIKSWNNQEFLKTLTGRFQALVEEGIRKLAEDKALETASQAQLAASARFEEAVALEVDKRLERIEKEKSAARRIWPRKKP
jgi:hypothetical protein